MATQEGPKLLFRYFKTYLNHLILYKMSYNTGFICLSGLYFPAYGLNTRVYGPMELYAKIVNVFQPLTIFTKTFNSSYKQYSVNVWENTDLINIRVLVCFTKCKIQQQIFFNRPFILVTVIVQPGFELYILNRKIWCTFIKPQTFDIFHCSCFHIQYVNPSRRDPE